jgi:DNA-binding Lrp family transcriptional regulator
MKIKDAKLRLISELMKNSRRSDRELAKAIGVSQPTVSRMIKKLESEGIIKEYSLIPDFHKLGFEILALTFLDVKDEPTINKLQNVVMCETGLGLRSHCVLISLHEDFPSYLEFKRQLELLNQSKSESFLVDLTDYHGFLTFSSLAEYLKQKQTKI